MTEILEEPLILKIQAPRFVTRGGGRSYQNPRVPRRDWRLATLATDEAQATTIRFQTLFGCARKFYGRRFRGQRFYGITTVEHESTSVRVVHLKQGWAGTHHILVRTTDPRIPLACRSGWHWEISPFQKLRKIYTPAQTFLNTTGRYGSQQERLGDEQGRELIRCHSGSLEVRLNLQSSALNPWSYLATLQYVAWYSYFWQVHGHD